MAKTKTETEPREIPTQPKDDGLLAESPLSKAEIEKAQAIAGTIATKHQAQFQSFIDWCVEKAQTTDEDQFEVMASIMAEIMAATSPEEVLKERSTLSAREIVNVPLLLHGFELREGTFEDSGTGYYAAMTVSRPGSDETRILTCGALKVIGKLMMLDKFDEWPQVIWFTEKQHKSGNTSIDMVQPTV